MKLLSGMSNVFITPNTQIKIYKKQFNYEFI